MKYQRVSLREIYGQRLRSIMNGDTDTYFVDDGTELRGEEVRVATTPAIVFKPIEVEVTIGEDYTD